MTSCKICAFVTLAVACHSEPAAPSARERGGAVSARPRFDGKAPTLPSSALAELDRLDSRAPVPLLPMMANHQKANMRDHLAAVQEIVAAAGVSDFEAVERAAQRIGYSEQMALMCNHMGAAAVGFSERALAFHHTADSVAAAARQHDVAAVLRALSDTLNSCTACHAAFKQHVVAELPAGR